MTSSWHAGTALRDGAALTDPQGARFSVVDTSTTAGDPPGTTDVS
ncbi:hypothetical protein [Streptomyces sp. NPDC006997]